MISVVYIHSKIMEKGQISVLFYATTYLFCFIFIQLPFVWKLNDKSAGFFKLSLNRQNLNMKLIVYKYERNYAKYIDLV